MIPSPQTYAKQFSLAAALFITCYVSYFLYSDMFGTYSDDQFFLTLYYTGPVTAMLDQARYFGRPLGFLSMSTLYPLFHIGGLPLAYIASCIVLTVEAILVWIFFRIYLAEIQAFMLAIIYLLFPADTSKFMFINGLFSHVSALLFWASAILYANNRPLLAALAAVITMLVYETHLAQALLIPLFVFIVSQLSNRPQQFQTQLKPACIFTAMFCISGLVLLTARLLWAPGRLPSTLPGGMAETAKRLLSAGWLGIEAVAFSLVNRVKVFISDISLQLCIILIFLILLYFLLLRMWPEEQTKRKLSLEAFNAGHKLWWSGALLFTGVFVMYISYLPFALEPERWPPTQILKQASSVHFGAAVGYVLMWAGLLGTIHCISRHSIGLSQLVFLFYSVIMAGFFLIYQQQLVKNWSLQTVYWRQIEECLRKDRPRLIIVDSGLEEERVGEAEYIFPWTTPYVPYLMKHEFLPAQAWPLVQTHALVAGKGQFSADKLKLDSLFTWYIFPTEAEIRAADIMVVKPLAGALVRPPQSFTIGASDFIPSQICYTAEAIN